MGALVTHVLHAQKRGKNNSMLRKEELKKLQEANNIFRAQERGKIIRCVPAFEADHNTNAVIDIFSTNIFPNID